MVELGYHGYVLHAPDVEVVRFSLVNRESSRSFFIDRLVAHWLHNVTVNQPESGCAYETRLSCVLCCLYAVWLPSVDVTGSWSSRAVYVTATGIPYCIN